MTDLVKDKKQLKADRKAAALAKKEAIANGTWVEPPKPKREIEVVEDVVNDKVHLLQVYSAQVGCMAEWIKHSHKPEGTETLFYSFNALQPLIKTVRTVDDYSVEYKRLNESLAATQRLLRIKQRKLTKIHVIELLWRRYEVAQLEHEITELQWQEHHTNEKIKKLLDTVFSFCAELNQHKDTL